MPGKVVSRSEWLDARKALLVKEKEALRAQDAFLAEARETLPWVKVDQEYEFEGPEGKVKMLDLFEGRKQLIVYHFMLGPEDKVGCEGCSFLVDNMPSHLGHLNYRDTSLVLISRASLANIEAFKKRMGWTYKWYSSAASSFNFDFNVSFDPAVNPSPSYNYKLSSSPDYKGELPGMSVFIKGDDGEVFHTYSTYARGTERILGTYRLLDMTPLGRQEGKEYEKGGKTGWLLHDEY